ncbi:MAG: hypothetical protein JXB00_12370 [Bacteroidales bacterium]|nr:hypothetical protein [Bacteroidales bacterium]
MKNKIFWHVFISLLLLFSCSGNKTKNDTQAIAEQTPDVLVNTKTEISSLTKRYSSDIIQNLFSEAVGKDPELKDLSDRINTISKLKNDSLATFREYDNNNSAYFTVANNYMNQLNDSVLRDEFKEIFNVMEAKYRNSISQHDSAIKNLDHKTEILNDWDIILKLSVTAPMIINYQKNELPDLNTLNNINTMYDTLIKETRTFSKPLKTAH